MKCPQYVIDTVKEYCKILNKPVPLIFISATKSKLGSCWGDGSKMQFSSIALQCGSIEQMKYLIAHECSHLIHQNHSKSFWKCVEMLCPNYKKLHKEFQRVFKLSVVLKRNKR